MPDEPDRIGGVSSRLGSVWHWILYGWIALYGIAVLPGVVFELTGHTVLWRGELVAHQPGVTWVFLGGLLVGLSMAHLLSLVRKVMQR